MNTLRYPFLLILLSAGALFMPQAEAASCSTSDLPYTMNAGNLAVSSSLSVGSVIPGSTQTHSVKGTCTDVPANTAITACYTGSGSEVPGYPGVYETGIAGVGIEVLNRNGQVIRGTSSSCDSSSSPMGAIEGSGNLNFTYAVQLVKTATQVNSGSLTQAKTRFGFAVVNGTALATSNTSTYSATIAATATTCAIDPLSLTVTLGDFPVSQFTNVGSHTGWKSFNINATCDSSARLTATVTSANGVNGHYADVINLTPGSDSANGVGVRMLIDGVDLKYDYPIPIGAPLEANIPMAIPFSVQYYQTDAVVTAGKANTIMTIDMEYE
ncbi:fimbrial protein [Enterobacter sp. UNJFSC 003]|uniref:fimbrial protein n=1 Tax=Enterobacter sp. UNJFSC 003 TaxID=3122077 RepID=UPI002EB3996A|nr:fimbrial protein [Serratia liquefaciens]